MVGVVANAVAVAALPDVLAVSVVGRSAFTIERKVGAAGVLPVAGPAQTVFTASVAKVKASVPVVVIGLPETEKMAGAVNATLVTEPPVQVW